MKPHSTLFLVVICFFAVSTAVEVEQLTEEPLSDLKDRFRTDSVNENDQKDVDQVSLVFH